MSTSTYRSLIMMYFNNKLCLYCLKTKNEHGNDPFNCLICRSTYHQGCLEADSHVRGEECCSSSLYLSRALCCFCESSEGLKRFNNHDDAHLTCKVNNHYILNDRCNDSSEHCSFCKRSSGSLLRCSDDIERNRRCKVFFHLKCHEAAGLSLPILLERHVDQDVRLCCQTHTDYSSIERVRIYRLLHTKVHGDTFLGYTEISRIEHQNNRSSGISRIQEDSLNDVINELQDSRRGANQPAAVQIVVGQTSSSRIEVTPVHPEVMYRPSSIVIEEISGFIPAVVKPPQALNEHSDTSTALSNLMNSEFRLQRIPESLLESIRENINRNFSEDMTEAMSKITSPLSSKSELEDEIALLSSAIASSRGRIQQDILNRMTQISKVLSPNQNQPN